MTTGSFLLDVAPARYLRRIGGAFSVGALALLAAGCEAGVLGPADSAAADIWVGWDRQSDPSVAEYVVYVGTDPDEPQDAVVVEAPTDSVTIRGLEQGRYYVAVSAVSARGVEGPLSEQVSVDVQ